MTTTSLPGTQHAVQLVGPGQLQLNEAKDVPRPGPHQILARVEAVGLCFSDLKLLKQFSQHVRKTEVISGIGAEILREIPSYVPGDKPTVPGHEVVCRVVAVGDRVQHFKVDERYLVQPDFRAFRTAGSNSAFGYNFEGALQEYLLLDERVVVVGDEENYLLPVDDSLGASQAALSEPWACVEDSYVTPERRGIKPGGRMLIAVAQGHVVEGLAEAIANSGKPREVIVIGDDQAADAVAAETRMSIQTAVNAESIADESCDDIIVFGTDKKLIESLNSKLIAGGIMNVVTGGKKIGEPVSAGVGRIHYGNTRWIGTNTNSAADSYKIIPATGEVRDGDTIIIIGAGGPMGQMHVIRNICSGKKGISVVATDFEDARLHSLDRKARPMADALGVELRTVNPRKEQLNEQFSYFAIMAPVPQLLVDAIRDARPGAIVNVFAGIPAPVSHEIDLDALIEKRVFLYGTSGSTLDDMKIILNKVVSGQLNTDASVDAISGMKGAIKGIEAVENRTMAGKIIVYPMLSDVDLIPLSELHRHFPSVAGKLNDGQWCKAAEDELLLVAGKAK